MSNTETAADLARTAATAAESASWHSDREPMTEVETAWQNLTAALADARRRVRSEPAKRCLREMDEALVDVRHDCSFGYVLDLVGAKREGA